MTASPGSTRIGDFSAWRVRVVILVVSIAVYVATALQFASLTGRIRIPEYWTPQFYFLLALSFGLSTLLIAVRFRRFRSLVLLSQFLVTLIYATPERSAIVLATCPMVLLIIEAVVFIDWPLSLLYVCVMPVAAVLLEVSGPTWVYSSASVSTEVMVTFLIVQYISGALSILLKFTNDKLVVERRANGRLNETINRLTSANVGYQSHLDHVSERSAVEERKRLSREIHDTVGYTITTLIMIMEAASYLSESDTEKLKGLLRDGIRQAYDGLDDIRHALRELRATEVKRSRGLAGMRRLVGAFSEATKIDVTIDFTNVRWAFDEVLESAAYRTIQEAMTNAFRHGNATQVRIVLRQTPQDLRIAIRDNGKGTKGFQEGIGIAGMRERITKLGGALNARNSEGGFLVEAILPVGSERGRHLEIAASQQAGT